MERRSILRMNRLMKKKNNVDCLISSILSHDITFTLYNVMRSFTGLMKEALIKEPRLLMYIDGYEYQVYKRGSLSLASDYIITMKYAKHFPKSIDDVIMDDGTYDLYSYKKFVSPEELFFVTNDSEALKERIDSSFSNFLTQYEGMQGYQIHSSYISDISNHYRLYMNFRYIMPLNQLQMYIRKSQIQANLIAKDLTRTLTLPPIIKIYLAFSYLQQNCDYDYRAYHNLEKDQESIFIDPMPHFSYGPLLEKRGICGGIAFAFRTLMESLNIECIVVNGYLKNKQGLMHAWNMVKVNNQYYHVDATYGIENNGICISSFMKDDKDMKLGYTWDENYYPKASGRQFHYDFIENWLIKHGDDLIDTGIDEDIVFPHVYE